MADIIAFPIPNVTLDDLSSSRLVPTGGSNDQYLGVSGGVKQWLTPVNALIDISNKRKGIAGNSNNDSEIQGIWSIKSNYAVDTSTDTLGTQIGLAWAYGTTAGAPFSGDNNFLFAAGGEWGSSISAGGSAWFKTHLVVGTKGSRNVPGDDRVVFTTFQDKVSDGFSAWVAKTYQDVDDLNMDGGAFVKHAKNYEATSGYADTLQVYSLAGSSGTIVGNNNFAELGSPPYSIPGSWNANGYISFELGPSYPKSERARFNNEGDFIVGWSNVNSGYTASQSGTTVTFTVGTVSASDVGHYLIWAGKRRVADKIISFTDSTHVEVETSRTMPSQGSVNIYKPKILLGKEGTIKGRILPRVGTIASSSTPSPNGDTDDIFTVTALAANATFAAPSGTPVAGQPLIIRIKDNGTARTLAFNSIYRAIGITLPTTTVISKTIYLGLIYNVTDTKWDVVSYLLEA